MPPPMRALVILTREGFPFEASLTLPGGRREAQRARNANAKPHIKAGKPWTGIALAL